jgi:hypothetical protein
MMDIKKMNELWQGFTKIKDKPELLKFIKDYLDVSKAAREGRLTPEGQEALKEFEENIERIHEQVIKE